MRVVCSIGPNVKSIDDLEDLILSGMTDARFNFSHVNYDKVRLFMDYLKKNHPNIRIIQDLQGNKIRVSPLYKREERVLGGKEIFFCSEEFYKKNPVFVQKYKPVPVKMDFEFSSLKGVKTSFMKDRTMEFSIMGKIKDKDVLRGTVVRGGVIRAEKGLNFPGVDRSKTRLLEKDRKDIVFGIENGADVICLSYVASAVNVSDFSDYVDEALKSVSSNIKKPKLWAKIECKDGITNLDDILKKVDGIMLGRGDLYSELSIFEVSDAQQEVITKLKRKRTKELIIATYVMETMRKSEIPSISEVNELSRFIDEKVDGVMLAGEITVGRHPLETVNFVSTFIRNKKSNIKVKEIIG